MARIDAGSNKGYKASAKPAKVVRKAAAKPAAQKVVRKTAPAPVTDVQSSGGDYGTRKAKGFTRAKTVKPITPGAALAAIAHSGGSEPIHFAEQVGKTPGWNRALTAMSKSQTLQDQAATQQGVGHALIQGAGIPVLQTLNETARPFHAVAGLVNAGPHGFTEGLIHNKAYSFTPVLKHLGVPGGVANVLGFGADVAADPVTYVTFGAGGVAEHAAATAAERVTTKALKAGFSEDAAKQLGETAARKAMKAAPAGKGLTVKFAGKRVPGVTRATGAAGRVVKTTTSKVPQVVRTAGGAVHRAAEEVRPQLRPIGAPEREFVGIRQAGRQARAQAKTGIGEAERRAQAARRLIPKDQYDHVIAAVESGKINDLPGELRVPARQIRDSLKGAKRIRQQAGVVEGDVTLKAGQSGAAKHYFPHRLVDDGAKPSDVPLSGTKGVRKVRLSSSKARQDVRPISVQNPERVAAGETPFSTNLPAVLADYQAGTAKAVAAKALASNLVKIGRPFKDGMPFSSDDVVFHYHNGDLTALLKDGKPVLPASEIPKAGRYVVLNRHVVEREFGNIAPQSDRGAILGAVDRLTGGFKRVATATPGFHARNLVGDAQMAYLKQPAYKLPKSIGQAGRAVRRLSKTEVEQTKTLGPVAATTKTIKVAGKPMNVDALLADAQKHGVIRSGFIGRELRELGKGVGGKERVGGIGTRAGHRVNRWLQNREDLLRLATYKHGLDKGLSPAQAAELSLGVHIDYGDLTKLERNVARRVVPFYTFSARGLPIHAKALVQTPGKFANIEKAREEIARASGVPIQDVTQGKNLKTYQARQAPIVLKLGGKTFVLSDSLPLNLLNEVPTSGNPVPYMNELFNWTASLLNPVLKDPVEYGLNRSFFFRNDIQSKDYPRVAAPSYVGQIYQHDRGLADSLGIVPDYIDKKSGTKTWGWYGKSDYLFKTIPGLFNYAQQLMTVGNRRGQSTGQKALGILAGVKSEPLDPTGAAMEILFQKHDQIAQQAAGYRQREKTPANMAAYRKLTEQQHQLEQQIYKLSVKQGDKIPIYRNAAPSAGRPLGSSGGALGSGLSGGGLSGGLSGSGL